MQLYRFSPIQNQEELLEAINFVHFACHKLCKQSLGKYLPNAGNIGAFCHYDEEYSRLVKIQKQLTKPSDNPDEKYFELYKPIIIPAQNDVPETTYTHLYIRQPDIYRAQVGDLDFYLERAKYDELKQSLSDDENTKGARIFPRDDLDMIELYDPDVDALGYVNPNAANEWVKMKLSKVV